MAKYYVVDTNVIMAASGKSSCSPLCARVCLDAIKKITSGSTRLVIDNRWRIIREYQANLNNRGQPGIGQAFLKWVLTNQQNHELCISVAITPKQSQSEDFEEFPSHPDLASFDPSDRKFVAVAATHRSRPRIAQATDSKWWGWKDALRESGIKVHFLCERELRETYEGKFSR
jgi:hypothetical protein